MHYTIETSLFIDFDEVWSLVLSGLMTFIGVFLPFVVADKIISHQNFLQH